MNHIWILIAGCLFPFLMTVLGAAVVFVFRDRTQPNCTRLFLGFSAGVMMAATIWSLIEPAIAAAEARSIPGWIPAIVGMSVGVLFLVSADVLMRRMTSKHDTRTPSQRRLFLLQLAMTLHNIPEGMAVGLSFALAAAAPGGVHGFPPDDTAWFAAMVLSLGIGIQNFPEGAATALPRLEEGAKPRSAFFDGCLSGVVEPIFGLATVFLLGNISGLMPWLLSFAAGAMLYVVCEELIPVVNGDEARAGSYAGTLSILLGFMCMMALDVALG